MGHNEAGVAVVYITVTMEESHWSVKVWRFFLCVSECVIVCVWAVFWNKAIRKRTRLLESKVKVN